jgi:hypothetical protein
VSGLLLIHVALLLLAVRRGWRLLPVAALALPHALVAADPHLPELAFAGWVAPFANVSLLIAVLCTASLTYAAIVDPEPA